jgi:pimeloyl-ACP methyl ester carboxylesterase
MSAEGSGRVPVPRSGRGLSCGWSAKFASAETCSDATFTRYDDVAAGEDTLALVELLSGPAVLVGNSMGAGAAVWAAAERPGAVCGLALLGPFVRNTPANPVMVLLFKAAMYGPWAARMWTFCLPKLYPGRRPEDFAEHRAAISASMQRGPREGVHCHHSDQPSASRSAPERGDGADAGRDGGARDPDFADPAAEARWIAERLDAKVVMIPGGGHYPQAEYPDLVNRR